MGGWVPLGYDRKDRTLVVNETEANTVRTIFDLFLKLRNVREVQAELARSKLKTKAYAVQRGRATGNLPFARGHLYKILSNPLYIGEIQHKGVRHPGQHPALITQATWDGVQAQLAANTHANRSRSNAKSTSLLAGLIYDEIGNRLVSSHATKSGKRYRYYVTSEGAGRSSPTSPKLRLPASTIDELVLTGLQNFMRDKVKISSFLRKSGARTAQIGSGLDIAGRLADSLASGSLAQTQAALTSLVARVSATPTNLKVRMNGAALRAMLSNNPSKPGLQKQSDEAVSFDVPFVAVDRTEVTKLRIEDHGLRQPDAVACVLSPGQAFGSRSYRRVKRSRWPRLRRAKISRTTTSVTLFISRGCHLQVWTNSWTGIRRRR
jgi:hypothetical protein